MATPLCMTRIFNSLCNIIRRHVLIPFVFIYFLHPLEDLRFIMNSGQPIYCTEFAKHSALQYRLLVRCFFGFYSIFLQLWPGCFVISTDLDRYVSRGLAAQSVTILSQPSAPGVWMELHQPWHVSTNPSTFKRWCHATPPVDVVVLEKTSVWEDFLDVVGVDVQQPVGCFQPKKLIMYCLHIL